MALKLVIRNGFYYAANSEKKMVRTTCDVPLDTEALTAKLHLKNSSGCIDYTLSLLNLSFQKKMYQPTDVVASIMIVAVDKTKWKSIDKGEISDLFNSKQVSLYDNTGITAITENGKVKDVVPKANEVGLDFYVQEVQTSYMSDSMIVTLKVNSPDKKLTLQKNSCTFVSKKLSAILNKNMPKVPYKDSETVAYSTDKMKILSYMVQDSNSNNEIREHIFPYLVQYNESFYDMLARTCNRWGEFLFYEGGQLNVGYSFNDTKKDDTSEKDVISLKDSTTSKDKYAKYTYIDLDETTIGDYFNRSANYDKNIIDNPYQKSPNKVEGLLFSPGEKGDVVAMNKFANFFKNDKKLPAFIVNEFVDDTTAWISKEISVNEANEEFNNDHFKSQSKEPEQYGEYTFKSGKEDGYNPFSEIGSKYVDDLYKTILSKEQAASKGALLIDFDTTFPGLKLGQVITIDSNYFIVVQIDCKMHYQKLIVDDLYVVDDTDNPVYVYQVIATPQDSTERNICYKDITDTADDPDRDTSKEAKNAPTPEEKKVKPFYPTILPTGHIRYADPQMAKVDDVDDPLGNGRVRVKFSWQDTSEKASPWLQFAANAGGDKGIMGKHYQGDDVFVGYVDGNVERPYVLGAISKGASSDVQCVTPGGHVLKINDDQSGVAKFLTGMLFPAWKSWSAFIPSMNEIKTSQTADSKLGGGFELTDNYGIYKVSGSSDGRNVTVASPWGDVKVNAFTGITISAPNGDVKITGKNVSIEAGNNLTLTSGTNVKAKIIDGTWDGSFSNLGGEIAAAVAKKLSEVLLNGLVSIDLTFIRNFFDIIFRPVEGKLLVKSNRYLMLESGKGECSYPEDAYVDQNTANSMIKKHKEKNLRPGLEVSTPMKDVANKIGDIVNTYNTNYITAYNNCYDKKVDFESKIATARVLANDYDGTNQPVICKTFDELKDDLWADTNEYFSAEKLGFKDNFKDDTVTDVFLTYYAGDKGLDISTDPQKEEVKKQIREARTKARSDVAWAAGQLRTSIMKFNSVLRGLTAEEVKKVVEPLRHFYFENNLLDALEPAFTKENLGDSFYCQAIAADKKDLTAPYQPADLDGHKSVLKRKAAILWLEKLGFENGWRKKMPNRDDSGHQVATVDATTGKPLPGTTSVPARPFNTADISKDNNWNDYLDSITAVPKLSPVKWKALEELKKAGDKWLDNFNAIKNIYENESWSNGKGGGILFSYDAKTYGLEDKINPNLLTIAKEKLSELDDPDMGVTTFLDPLRRILKSF